jgi:hypothetical protein
MDPEIIDISNLTESLDAPMKLSNCGGGLELLMNDKVKEGGIKKVELEDINSLENELNNLVDDNNIFDKSYENKSDIFNLSSSNSNNVRFSDESKSVHTTSLPSSSTKLGQATASTESDKKTWDGFSTFNNIPVNPDKAIPAQPQMSKEDMLREKFKYLRKLEGLEAKGVNLTKKYTMESSLLEMQGEYEMIMEEKSKQNSMKFQGNMLMAIINGIEFLNNRFDPFDIKLEGWSDQINENLNDYDDIFSELHDKYKSRASLAPELKLLFQLGGSAMMVHMTNTMFKSSMPGMDDILRQNPELMRQFQTAAVNSMGQSNPGFSGFMNGIMSNDGPPPPPMSTQNRDPMANRPGNNSSSIGSSDYARFSNTRPAFDDGINIRESYDEPGRRMEMRGPSDISHLLSGLKTKTISIQEQQKNNNDSTISISDLKDLQTDGGLPKRSKRRPKSDKNSISLDI